MPPRDNQTDPDNPYSGAYGPGGLGNVPAGPTYDEMNPPPPAPPPPPPPSAPPSGGGGMGGGYPTGPRSQPGLHQQAQTQASDIFAGLNAYAVAQAKQLVDQMQALIGWPQGVDWNKAIIDIVNNGWQTVSATNAWEKLYHSGYLTDAQRAATPWAEYGLTKEAFDSVKTKLGGVYSDLMGDQMPPELLKRAIQEQWSPTEIDHYVRTGDPTGKGKGTIPGYIAADNPWLEEGGSYKQIHNAYYAATPGADPNVDRHTLAAWFNFNKETSQVARGGPVRETVAQESKKSSNAEVR